MLSKLRIILFVCCATFAQSLLADGTDIITALLLKEPLVMDIGSVPVRLEYVNSEIVLVIPGGSNIIPIPEVGGSSSHAVAGGDCESQPCRVGTQLRRIQERLRQYNIPELALRLTPFSRASSFNSYSDDSASGCEVVTSTSDINAANFVLHLSFIFENRSLSEYLQYRVRRNRVPMDWLWSVQFFNAPYARGRLQTEYFDPLQEGVLTDILRVLDGFGEMPVSEELRALSPGQTGSYHPCLFDIAAREVGSDWLQPLGNIRTVQRTAGGQSQLSSSIQFRDLLYSLSLPGRRDLPSGSPSVRVTELPSVFQRVTHNIRGVAAGATLVVVTLAVFVYQQVYGIHGKHLW